MKPKSKWLRIGSVRVFDEVEPSKAQALKVVEEASEVFGAWQLTHLPDDKRRLHMWTSAATRSWPRATSWRRSACTT